MTKIFFSESESETEDTAFALAFENKIKSNDIIALCGEPGAGKTAFARGIARCFSPGARVTSPTFSIVNQYKNIFHFDMYRIDSENDLLSVGFYDYLGGKNLIIIEWFDKIAEFFDEYTIKIDIEKSDGDKRKIYVDTRC